jgi:hypothetical protein
MHAFRIFLASTVLVFTSGLRPANAQFSVIDVDVTFPTTVTAGEDLVVNVPAGVGLPALLFFAPTASLNLTTEVYASELGAQLALFQSHGVAVIQPDFTATWTGPPVPFPVDFTVFIAGFVAPDIIASNIADITLLPDPCPGTPGHFQESNGLVVAEIESVPAVSQWLEESTQAGFTGESYYRWTGPNHFGQPGNAILTYPIEIYNAGTYTIRIHNFHSHPKASQQNDCWIRVDGGTWHKFFSNAGLTGVWNWAGGIEGGGGSVAAEFFLGAGTHTIEISARSFGYHIDRMHVYRPDLMPFPNALSHPESCRP